MQKPDETSNGELLVRVKKWGSTIQRLKYEYRDRSVDDMQRTILRMLFAKFIANRPKSILSAFLDTPQDTTLVQRLNQQIDRTTIEVLLNEIDEFCEKEPTSDLRYLLIAFIIYMPVNLAIKSFNLGTWLTDKTNEYRSLRISRLPKDQPNSNPTFYNKKENILPKIDEVLHYSNHLTYTPVYISLTHEQNVLDYLIATKVSNYKVMATLRFYDIDTTTAYLEEQFNIQKEDEIKLRIINILINIHFQPKTDSGVSSKAMFEFLLALYNSKDFLEREETLISMLKLFISIKKEVWASFLTDGRMLSVISDALKLIPEPKKFFPKELLLFLLRAHQVKQELFSLPDVIDQCYKRLILLMGPAYSEFNMQYAFELASYFSNAFKKKMSMPLEFLPIIIYAPRTPDNFSIPSFKQFLGSIVFEGEQDSTLIFGILKKLLEQFKIGKETYMNSFYAEIFFITAERFNLGFTNIIGGLEKDNPEIISCKYLFERLLTTNTGTYQESFRKITEVLRTPIKKLDSNYRIELLLEFDEETISAVICLQENPPEVTTCFELFVALPTLKQLNFRSNLWDINTWKVVRYFCFNFETLCKSEITIGKSMIVESARWRSFSNRFDWIIIPLEAWLEKNKTSTTTRNTVLEILEEVYDLPRIEQADSSVKQTVVSVANF